MGVLVDGSGGVGGGSTLVTARFWPFVYTAVGIRTASAAASADLCIATNMVLYRNFRIHHVFGANTDVGKTVFSTVLTLASVAADRGTFYLKPVSTGPLTDADDRCVGILCFLPTNFIHFALWCRHIARYLPTNSSSYVSSKCLYQFQDPTSPHLAVKNASQVRVSTFSMALNLIQLSRRHRYLPLTIVSSKGFDTTSRNALDLSCNARCFPFGLFVHRNSWRFVSSAPFLLPFTNSSCFPSISQTTKAYTVQHPQELHKPKRIVRYACRFS
jgi:hypothetical protein